MNPMCSFCFVLLLWLLIQQKPVESADLITEACAQTLYKELCEQTLRADPSSKTADIQGLDKIAIKAAASTAETTQGQVAKLLKSTSDKAAKAALTDCAENYSNASEELSDSLVAVDLKRYADVSTWVAAAMSAADSCEEGFKSGTSPLTQANTNFSHLCSNVLALSKEAARS